ncbi:WD40 repeat-like protein [Amniculicola lignicola CBS 123094]|uniref:ASTRA-associated protein 1 n=1 Tax=Amniculicola lignicola CBS 123094 TaxID=1392246 RepID=A0A6A5VV40_9PLEO|nr:WD40 repeat-like protein [Amniculicola lignicola CBS 123094]
MAVERQASTLPPAQPAYIFRGHTSQIHSVQIVHKNTRLVTGDADGCVVCWKLESKRPVAVWRAHDAAILGTAEWGVDRVITHGRDNTLRIWQMRATDEGRLSTILPAEGLSTHRPKPWLLHSVPVNTLNFCAFSMCHVPAAFNIQRNSNNASGQGSTPAGVSDSILVAVPSRDDKKIEVYRFPDESLVCVVPRVETTDTGMVMAVKLTHHQPTNGFMVIAGYEGGFTAVHYLDFHSPSTAQASPQSSPVFAHTLYLSQPHTQPILSLDTSPDAELYFTSSADAIIAAHCMPEVPLNIRSYRSSSTVAKEYRSTGVSLNAEDPPQDPLVLSTLSLSASNAAGHHTEAASTAHLQASLGFQDASDAARTVGVEGANPAGKATTTKTGTTSTKADTPPPGSSTSLLPFNISVSSDPVASPPLTFSKKPIAPLPSAGAAKSPQPSVLSSQLSSGATNSSSRSAPPPIPQLSIQPPFKTANTKHAGQQSLCVRSDGRIMVTAGWDGRVRVYSTKTLKELAVLKWHKEGVYAAAFGGFLNEELMKSSGNESSRTAGQIAVNNRGGVADIVEQTKVIGLGKLQQQREQQIQAKHWVVAGAKDGKVSLWEVF